MPNVYLDPKGTGSSVNNIELNSSANAIDSFVVDLRGRWAIAIPSNANWFKLSAVTGTNQRKIYVTSTSENNSAQPRSANIILRSAGRHSSPITITINQKGKQWLINKLVGGSNWDVLNGILPLAGGGLIAVGSTWSSDGDVLSNNGELDAWAVKLNAQGAIVWSRTYGDAGWNTASKILKIDGGYIVMGSTVLEENTQGHVATPTLMKINENGDQLWLKILDLGNEAELSAISACSSGGFILCGTASDQAVLLRLNDSGEEIWRKNYGGENLDWARSLTQTSDGGFIATGLSGLPRVGTQADWDARDAWVFKVDENGDMLWSKLFGGSMNEGGFEVGATTDGGAVVAAKTESPDLSGFKGAPDIFLFRIDANGNIQWQRLLGSAGMDLVSDMTVLPDGNILLCGSINQAGDDVAQAFGGADAWLVKLSGAGDIAWQRTIGGPETESISEIALFENKVYMAGTGLGTTGEFSSNHGSADGWVVVINQP